VFYVSVMTTTAPDPAWVLSCERPAMGPAQLADLLDREADRFSDRLFTITPREELAGIERAQRLLDQAFVLRAREIVASFNRVARDSREFVCDEVAVALSFSPTGADKVTYQSLALAALPGMLEAVEGGHLTQNHALSVLRELDTVELSTEQRAAVAFIVLHRLKGQTPGELMTLTRTLILQVDPVAAAARDEVARGKRRVVFYPGGAGQGSMQLHGPVEHLAAVEAQLSQLKKDHPKPEGLTVAQWEYELVLKLLTGELAPGNFQAAIVVPFSVAAGSDLELAEVPGFGPILPSTARQLLQDAEWNQVAVDHSGEVIAVGDPLPAPRPAPEAAEPAAEPAAERVVPTRLAKAAPCPLPDQSLLLERLRLISQQPPKRLTAEQLGTDSYVATARLKRYLRARDRHCVFPGCHRRVTDVDHRIPWPLGKTDPENCQLLCRHHHRAKQKVFTVELTAGGDYLWTTRGGLQILRERQGY
jgi:hypothetical protein